MIKSIIKWFFIVALTLLIGATAALYVFKDRIVAQVIIEVNKSLAAPIDVRKVDIEFFHGFPNISVAFYDVELPANSENALLKAEKLYLLFDVLSVIKGEMKAEVLEVENATIAIIVDSDQQNNFSRIFKIQPSTQENDSTKTSPKFRLNTIVLRNIKVDYQNLFTMSRQQWHIENLKGSLLVNEDILATKVVGNLTLNNLSSRTWASERPRKIYIDLGLGYNFTNQFMTIGDSYLEHGGAKFNLDGDISFGEQPAINLKVEGEEINFKLLKSVLPANLTSLLNEYQSKGLINFSAEFKGDITPTKLPELVAKLELIDLDLTKKEFNARISHLNIRAELELDDIGDLASGKIKFTTATGKLQGNPFTMDLSVTNFANPNYTFEFAGDISTAWLLAAAKFPYHETGKGLINVSIEAKERHNSKGELIDSNLSGSFKIDNVSFQWADTVVVDRVAGTILMDGDIVNISNFSVEWLGSDLTINGTIKDLLKNISNNNGRILLLADVKSRNLAIEDIVTLLETKPVLPENSSSGDIKLDLEMTCIFDNLSFRRYEGKDISGELFYQDDVLEVVNLNGKGMGGESMVNGKLYTLTNKDFYIDARALTKGIYLDSMFYVFDNFTQDFITDKDLRGKLYADVSATMFFDSTWRFRRKLFKSDAKLRIVGGELKEFEPIMALSDYIDERNDNLSNLRFSDLVNYITIRDDTVFIPEMSIQTNVRNIAIGGYHTLDQHINYQLAVPILVNERIDKDEAFGAIQESTKGSPNLLFRIKGTASDFKVNYDVMRATGNVLKLLDLTRIFQKKEDTPADTTFLNDEEFDWQN